MRDPAAALLAQDVGGEALAEQVGKGLVQDIQAASERAERRQDQAAAIADEAAEPGGPLPQPHLGAWMKMPAYHTVIAVSGFMPKHHLAIETTCT